MNVRTANFRQARRPLVIAVALALTSMMQSALAAPPLPSGFDHTGLYGNVTAPVLDTTGKTMTITQTTRGAVIQWDSFNIDQGYHVAFAQPDASSVTLNRVTGAGSSQINGMLTAPGQVFVINPGGVMFGTSAQINVGGLVASTLDISDNNFITGLGTGHFVFNNGNDSPISNAGQISTSSGGTVAFIGGTTSNSGSINTPGGTIAMGGGYQVTLDIGGDGLTQLVIDQPYSYGNNVDNGGTLQADGGKVTLTANTLTLGAGVGVVNQHGIVQAHSLQNRGGVIELGNTPNSTVEITGSDDASAGDAGVAGGSITVSANNVLVNTGATFNASGGSGAANGSLTIDSVSDVMIASAGQIATDLNNNLNSTDTHLLDSALGGALGNNTNVTVNGLGSASGGGAVGGSVWILNGITPNPSVPQQITDAAAKIVKSTGGDAQFTVNANRDIWMENASAITSSSGSLGVDFNADSTGLSAPIPNTNFTQSGGHIELDGASIASNGGAIRFYGQSNTASRATGSVEVATPPNLLLDVNVEGDGIDLYNSTLDTCAYAGTSCGGSGSINLRGQGIDDLFRTPISASGMGISALGSTLRSGSGAITLDGVGGTVASGVVFDNNINLDTGTLYGTGAIQSLSGAINITGVAGNEAVAGSAAPYDTASGVLLGSVPISTGGSINVQGTGATRSIAGSTQSIASSDGVDILGTSLNAGAGQSITVSGQAGSAGERFNAATGIGTPIPVYGVYATHAGDLVRSTPGGLVGNGGTLATHGLAGSDLYVDTLLDASTASGAGGQVTLDGSNIQLTSNAHLDTDGSNSGGQINVNAAGVLAMDAGNTTSANALGTGNGGSITLFGTLGLYAYGSASAQGGSVGGNGGSIDTSSGGGVSLNGFRANAGATKGNAGRWSIDPYDVNIVNGNAAGTLTSNPFVPLTASTIQDGDINAALDNNTSVTITTGAAASGSPSSGAITLGSYNAATGLYQGIDIHRTTGTAPVTLTLNANTGISTISGPSSQNIRSDAAAGALNLVFDTNVNGLTTNTSYSGIYLTNLTIATNGGSVLMGGGADPTTGYAEGGNYQSGLVFNNVNVDTRSAGAGGASVTLRGSTHPFYGGYAGAYLSASTIDSGNADIVIDGQGNPNGNGVTITSGVIGNTITSSSLLANTGNILVTGISAGSSGFTGNNSTGVRVDGANITTQSGNIDIRGRLASAAATPQPGDLGVLIGAPGTASANTLQSTSGNILLSGWSNAGAAVTVNAANASTGAAAGAVNAGSGNIIVRAHNAAGNPALDFGGTLASTGVIDLRPGGVDANGNPIETPADLINIAGAANQNGFALSQAELGKLTAGTLVLGSDQQSGNIAVTADAGNINYAGNLTLYAGGGGAVQLNGSALNVGANTLALVAGGNISQAGAITAGSLLAISRNGSVQLNNPLNQVSANTVAGSAATDFSFINAGDVGIGAVNATGITAATNAPSALAASGIGAGGNVFVQSIAGNLLLNANVSGTAVNLVADGPTGLFLNNAGASIAATSYWHIWASSWVGESRGGLAGSGTLPNLYGCAYGAACTVTPLNTANQFIYIAQPVATIAIDNLSREYGLVNPALTFATSGMILGDQAINAISGTPVTAATQASNVGSYAINGNFTSPAGYALKIANGALAVTPATLTYVAAPYSRVYGDPNGALAGTLTGFRLTDTEASATTGTLVFTTPATQASNVGTYAIDGGGLSATNYVFVQATGNTNALTITPATLTYTADPLSRLYGDPNGALTGTLTGFKLTDTQASATTGSLAFTTPATQASNVGSYAIDGSGLSATNYVFVQAAGNATALTINPATLTYMANPLQRLVGTPNGNLGGSVTGFKLNDTLTGATTGTLGFQSPAGTDSPVGSYGIFGSGLSATNYVFVQANGNATALTIAPQLATYTLDVVREMPVTYVYDSNFGIVGLCPAPDLAAGSREQEGDTLAREWSRVRSRPNLANCISSKQKNSCGDF